MVQQIWHFNGHDSEGRDFNPMYAGTTDANLAAAEVLERYARKLRANGNIEDIGMELLPVVRIMARRLDTSSWLP